MKMNVKLMIVALAAFVFLSVSSQASAQSLAAEFKAFVDTVEANGKNYTEQQWKVLNEQFDKMVEEYKVKKESISDADRKSIHDDIGRYKGVVMNSDFDSAKKAVTETYNDVAQSTTEAYNEVKGFFNGLFKKK